MMESNVAGVVGPMADHISIPWIAYKERNSGEPEAFRVLSDDCKRFETISLRIAGPSKG
jgi:hypothetical protein